MTAEHEGTPSTGLLGSIRRFAENLVGLLQTRLEILSTDIAEGQFNLVRMVLVALGVLFCFQAGVILAVLFLVLSAAAADRLAAVGIAALALLVMAFAGALWLGWWLKTRPPFFASTIAELKKDRERIAAKK
jgi:uncharacterized membrane protein YqjE